MSILKILEANIRKKSDSFSEYYSDLPGDLVKGCEFMFYALSEVFQDNDIEEIEGGIVDAAYRKATYDFGIHAIYITTATDFNRRPSTVG